MLLVAVAAVAETVAAVVVVIAAAVLVVVLGAVVVAFARLAVLLLATLRVALLALRLVVRGLRLATGILLAAVLGLGLGQGWGLGCRGRLLRFVARGRRSRRAGRSRYRRPLLEQGVAKIVPVLAAMTGEELARLEALETAGKNRKGLLAEVTVERLKRAAGGGAGVSAEDEKPAGDEDGSAGDIGAGEGEAG